MKLLVDILNEIDDIIFASLLVALMFSISFEGIIYEEFSRYLFFFLIYLFLKIIFLKELSLILYYDHVEFYAIRRPKKFKKENVAQAFFLGIFRYLQAAPSFFFTILSLITGGLIKVPIYGKLQVTVGFRNVKGASRQAMEKCHISLFSISFDILFTILLIIIGSGLAYIPLLISLSLLLPYIAFEGTNIFVWKRNLWIFLFLSQLLSFVFYYTSPILAIYPLLFSFLTIVFLILLERRS